MRTLKFPFVAGDLVEISLKNGRAAFDNGPLAGFNNGRRIRVQTVHPEYGHIAFDVSADPRKAFTYGVHDFTLVEAAPEKDASRIDIKTAQELVDIANMGVTARKELQNRFPREVEHSRDGKEWMDIADVNYQPNPVYRLKPVPKFEPFTVGGVKAWRVRLGATGRTVEVGCKAFVATYLQSVLHDLIIRDHNTAGTQSEFKATKDGIVYEGEKLSWADADKIFNALNQSVLK